jgi:acyl dehydratase
MIQAFADCTHDQQWIHTYVERAKKESMFGSTIAH